MCVCLCEREREREKERDRERQRKNVCSPHPPQKVLCTQKLRSKLLSNKSDPGYVFKIGQKALALSKAIVGQKARSEVCEPFRETISNATHP